MSRLHDLTSMLREKRVGFVLHEVMSGDHEFEPGMGPQGRLPFEFRVDWGPRRLSAWLNPWGTDFLNQELTGDVTIGGLGEKIPCKGTMSLRYFSDATIRYQFEFHVNDVEYRYDGCKVNIRPWNLPFSHTTCFGVVVEKATGKLVSRSVAYFRLKTMPAFLASFKLA